MILTALFTALFLLSVGASIWSAIHATERSADGRITIHTDDDVDVHVAVYIDHYHEVPLPGLDANDDLIDDLITRRN